MKFTINLTKDDFAKFSKFSTTKIHQKPGNKWKVTLFNLLYWCLIAVFVLEMYSVYDEDCCYNYEHLNKAMFAIGIWFVLVNIWQQIYMRIYVSTATDMNGSVLGKWEYEITEASITESNDRCSSRFNWSCIQSAEKDDHNLYLFTDTVKALILPLNQITQDIELEINRQIEGRDGEEPSDDARS